VIGSRRFEEKKSKKTVEDKALQSFETSESTQSATQMHNLQSRILAYFCLYQELIVQFHNRRLSDKDKLTQLAK
jgi:hypothetical protein